MTTLKVTRLSPGSYAIVDGLGREWTVVHNPEISGSAKWVAYLTNDADTVLDPLWTLREVKAAIEYCAMFRSYEEHLG